MKRKASFFVAVLLVLALAPAALLSACSSSPTTPASATASLGQEFTLQPGGSASISGENLAVKFIEVTGDSRCPQDATCIWQGEASALVEVTMGTVGPSSLVLTQPGLTDQPSVQEYAGYDFTFKINPYPTTQTQIKPGDYRLVITVTRHATPASQIELAPIDDVKVAVTVTDPKDVIVYIKGGLKNTCTTFNGIDTRRSGSTITITVNVQVLTDQLCGQVYTFFERSVDLGSDFVSGQTYTVKVNDTTTTFTMP